ncbi:alanine racemase [Crassaminicella profunda]|uniref:alanine racemase n=1 Tax=Crassaminicella profunda TaxID=1286698 RepID=UPI001CA68706|nr:alanine racemase [Crassaminicella profunda]QZY53685.1 alanine racemase [Crassaminicella profunda]
MCNAFFEINLDYIINNLEEIKKEMKNQSIMAIVKGEAYGHGLVEVAKSIENQVDYLGVGLEYEAIKLRNHGIHKPILILSPYFNADKVLDFHITPSIDNMNDLIDLSKKAVERNEVVKFHLKINTGMNRFGLAPEKLDEFIDTYLDLENVSLEGVFSHFAAVYNHAYVDQQLTIFNSCITKLKEKNIDIEFIHMANSKAALEIPKARFNMVRIGNAIYGKIANKKGLNIKTAGRFMGKIIDTRHIKKGEFIGYGIAYKAKKDIRIGIIPIGFYDGFEVGREIKNYSLKDVLMSAFKSLYRYKKPRDLVYVGNIPLKTVGKANMQFLLVDLTDQHEINVDTVVEIMTPSFFVGRDIERKYVKTIDPFLYSETQMIDKEVAISSLDE